MPGLLGWAGLLLPLLYGYALLMVCFSGLCLLDKLAGERGVVPVWYPPMRVILTTVVVACLIAAALAVAIG